MSSRNQSVNPPAFSNETPAPPAADVQDVLQKVKNALAGGDVDGALALLSRTRLRSPWLTNAAGVCQLRLRNHKVAVDVFRSLVLAPGGLLLRTDVPPVFLANYAAALLGAGNVGGAHRVLNELDADGDSVVQRLRQARRNWLNRLTIWQKLNVWTGGQPAVPIEFDFPVGELGLYSGA
jgi:hypothetical protein